ncbi:sigma-70 family RNA polymerase sigma factor [Oscillospiraceae bacterium MB08-C2-2]|nr:sigma-70 family RNA polymerase sigma factor [Oscillospiraceae bacterium MB08-C2-2]
MENEILMHFRNQRKCAQDVFISDPIDTDKDGNSLTLMDIMSSEEDIFDNIELRLQSERMYSFISKHLNKREQKIIILRYGLFCQRPLTQREVADKLNISRSYVSRIEKKAISILQKQFHREGYN